MQTLPTEIIYTILNKLSIDDLFNMKQTSTEYNDILTYDTNYSNILDQANSISNDSPLTYSIFTNKQLLSYYLQLHPDHNDISEQDYAISTLLNCNKFFLIDIIVKHIKQTPDWNKYLFNCACQGNKEAILYCLSKGANNLAECCFAVKLYGHTELLKLFIDKESIREAFMNGEYNKFYEYMQSN